MTDIQRLIREDAEERERETLEVIHLADTPRPYVEPLHTTFSDNGKVKCVRIAHTRNAFYGVPGAAIHVQGDMMQQLVDGIARHFGIRARPAVDES